MYLTLHFVLSLGLEHLILWSSIYPLKKAILSILSTIHGKPPFYITQSFSENTRYNLWGLLPLSNKKSSLLWSRSVRGGSHGSSARARSTLHPSRSGAESNAEAASASANRRASDRSGTKQCSTSSRLLFLPTWGGTLPRHFWVPASLPIPRLGAPPPRGWGLLGEHQI